MRTLFPFSSVSSWRVSPASRRRPRPFYKWQSKLDGQVACMQTSPGDGWVRLDGPYRDLRCREPLR